MNQISLETLYYRSREFKPSKSDARKIAILEEAMRIISTKGISQLSIQGIAKKLKMQRSHVVYYYPSIEPLVDDVMHLVIATGQEVTVGYLANAKSAEEFLVGYIEATFLWFHLHPQHVPIFLLLCHQAVTSVAHKKWLSELRLRSVDRIQGIVVMWMQQVRKKKVNASWARDHAEQVRNLLTGNLLNYYTTEPTVAYNTFKLQTIETIKELLR